MSEHKLIFIEGLPGSGKTTFAKRLYEHLVNQDKQVKLYTEGKQNPFSLALQSIFNQSAYDELLVKYPELAISIKKHTIKRIGKNILAYTLVDVPETKKDFYNYVSKYEIYNVTKEEYSNTYQLLYEEFKTKNPVIKETNIFECALMQNQINQTLAFYNLSKVDIVKHFRNLVEHLKTYNYIVLYIKQVNISKTLKKISSERLSPNKNIYSDWIDMAIESVERSPYGRANNLKGEDGLLNYFTIRQQLEEEMLKQLCIPHIVIELEENYENVFENMIKSLEKS